MKAGEIITQLRTKYSYNEWAALDELRAGTGYRGNSKSMIDLWVMNCWPSQKHVILAFEVKVSRSDFKVEIMKPWKRQAALDRSNHFYFATPKGLLKTAEIPDECGLMEFTDSGAPQIKVEAPWRGMSRLGMSFIASLARRVAKSEEALREEKEKK